MTQKHILYIHGAGASPLSFAYIEKSLPEHQSHYVELDSGLPIAEQIRFSREAIADINKPLIVIGHSLGGVIAASLHDHPMVSKIITICAPFGGVPSAAFAAMFSSCPLLHDLAGFTPWLRKFKAKTISKPLLALTASNGMPFYNEPNDGVVSVRSQNSLKNVAYKNFNLNHFEVLLSTDVIDTIKNYIFDDGHLNDIDQMGTPL